jgi:hypothetical protein
MSPNQTADLAEVVFLDMNFKTQELQRLSVGQMKLHGRAECSIHPRYVLNPPLLV